MKSSSSPRHILVAGGAGYIGSVLVRELLKSNHRVTILDKLLWGKGGIAEILGDERVQLVEGDIRNRADCDRALGGVDSVIQLAAIVGDPACAKDPDLARSTNLDGSRTLLNAAMDQAVDRFIFTSTCSNYGKMTGDGYCDETSPLKPVSLYAETKVEFERTLLGIDPSHRLVPTALRLATAYGVSPRMRFDLTVNEFTRDLYLGKKLVVYGESFWRPYCHIGDIAKAFAIVIGAKRATVDHQVFNVGSTRENYQKKTIADIIARKIDNSIIEYVHKDEDPRDYRVSFDKIFNILGFRNEITLSDGIDEIIGALKNSSI